MTTEPWLREPAPVAAGLGGPDDRGSRNICGDVLGYVQEARTEDAVTALAPQLLTGPGQHPIDVGLVLLERPDECGVLGVIELGVADLAALHWTVGGRCRHLLCHGGVTLQQLV